MTLTSVERVSLLRQDSSTITTMPEATLKAFADHGNPDHFLPIHASYCDHTLAEFTEAGIDIDALGQRLQDEGVEGFVKSWQLLQQCVASKRESLMAPGAM